MSQLTFDPWIGKHYESGGIFGYKTLILGESHYDSEKEGTYSEFTIDTVQYFAVDRKKASRFFSMIPALVLMKNSSTKVSEQERIDFWNSVAFYNYVQSFVGNAARMRPTPEQWKDAQPLFLNTLDQLKPDFCIALGFDLCRHLPSMNRKIETHHECETFVYERSDGGQTYLACTKHPAAGLSYNAAHERIRALFAIAEGTVAAD